MFARFTLCFLILCTACELKADAAATEAAAATAKAPAVVVPKDQTFLVRYNRTLKEAWVAAHVNSIEGMIVEQNFRKQESEFGNQTLAGKKFSFLTDMTCGAVSAHMAGEHYRPATLMEQLSYMEAFPVERFTGDLVNIGTLCEHDGTENGTLIHIRDYVYVNDPNTKRDLKVWRCNIPIGKNAIFLGIKDNKPH